MKMSQACLALLLMLRTSATLAQQSAGEIAVWKLEHSYWDDVKALDLTSYRALWHADFVGWPSVSPNPLRKDHITDWIDLYTTKGLHLKSYSLQPAASNATGNIVVTYYWITNVWADKSGSPNPETSRITHTWIKTPEGWQIIDGMSAAVPQEKK